jgi:hypothetical protein
LSKYLKMPLAALAIAMAALAAGCGSDAGGAGTSSSSSDAIATSSLSKAQFAKKADGFCKARHKRLATEFTDFSGAFEQWNPNGNIYPGLIRKVLLPEIQDEIDAIRALGAPQGDEERVTAILSALEEGIRATEAKQPITTATQVYRSFQRGDDLASEYGLGDCGY